LHGHLVPAALALLVLSFVFFYWSGTSHPLELFKHITKLFLIVLLITRADSLINDAQAIMEQFVRDNIDARPENVAQRYKDKLSAAQNASEKQSWWEMLLSAGANFFEAIIYAVLLLVSWLAMALLFYISIFQKVLLLFCCVLSPLLFACFAVPPLAGLAWRHCLRITGILLWPLGLALAATITDGLLDLQTDRTFIADGSLGGAVRYLVVNLLAVASVGLWILFSSVLAPAVMQQLITGGAGATHHISRAASLFTNFVAPGLMSATFALLRRGWMSRGSSGAADNTVPPPLINLPEPTPAMDPPQPPPADDPTGEKSVQKALEKSA
jgi:hypothetical protein